MTKLNGLKVQVPRFARKYSHQQVHSMNNIYTIISNISEFLNLVIIKQEQARARKRDGHDETSHHLNLIISTKA